MEAVAIVGVAVVVVVATTEETTSRIQGGPHTGPYKILTIGKMRCKKKTKKKMRIKGAHSWRPINAILTAVVAPTMKTARIHVATTTVNQAGEEISPAVADQPINKRLPLNQEAFPGLYVVALLMTGLE